MPTAEQILAKLHEMRKEFSDEDQEIEYLALHYTFLFLSYKINDFKQFLQDTEKQQKASEPK